MLKTHSGSAIAFYNGCQPFAAAQFMRAPSLKTAAPTDFTGLRSLSAALALNCRRCACLNIIIHQAHEYVVRDFTHFGINWHLKPNFLSEPHLCSGFVALYERWISR
jgi:hypothetical protein